MSRWNTIRNETILFIVITAVNRFYGNDSLFSGRLCQTRKFTVY